MFQPKNVSSSGLKNINGGCKIRAGLMLAFLSRRWARRGHAARPTATGPTDNNTQCYKAAQYTDCTVKRLFHEGSIIKNNNAKQVIKLKYQVIHMTETQALLLHVNTHTD